MKFFFELVSCCGVPAYRRPDPPPEDEMRWLVVVPTSPKTPPPQRSHRRRKRGRVGGSRAEGEWKPSLSAISEDNVVAERAVESERMAKRKSVRVRDRDRDRDRDRSQSNGFGRNSIPPVMPTFSPTPFMF